MKFKTYNHPYITEEDYQKIVELLTEIKDKLGPYSMDHFKHAENVIDSSSENAKEILKLLGFPKE